MMKHADPNSLLVTLPADQMQRLNELVESGEYASRDEVILDALRLWEEQHTDEGDRLVVWHRREHEEGLASGLAEDLSPEERLLQFKTEFRQRG
jgi:Arc/MetJ-type ribon-helix-helix transcriptional regulator